MLKNIFSFFFFLFKQLPRIAIIKLILMKRSDLNLIRILSLFLLIRVRLLFDFNPHRPWMSERLWIFFIFIVILKIRRTKPFRSWSVCPKLETILVSFWLPWASCWKLSLTVIGSSSVVRWLGLSQKRWFMLWIVDTARSWVFSIPLIFIQIGLKNSRLARIRHTKTRFLTLKIAIINRLIERHRRKN